VVSCAKNVMKDITKKVPLDVKNVPMKVLQSVSWWWVVSSYSSGFFYIYYVIKLKNIRMHGAIFYA
jgi:hypothetical protein